MNFSIETTTPADVPSLLELIRELARFERLEHEVQATADSLHESLFGSLRAAARNWPAMPSISLPSPASSDGSDCGWTIFMCGQPIAAGVWAGPCWSGWLTSARSAAVAVSNGAHYAGMRTRFSSIKVSAPASLMNGSYSAWRAQPSEVWPGRRSRGPHELADANTAT